MSDWLDLTAFGQVVLGSLAAGVGLALCFSLALAGFASPRPVAKAAGVLCLLVVAAGAVLSLYVMLRK
ncbi:hypothetical protein Aph01nite_38640 [Acrocarpospora phusangensis]|uniref:Uncharacterized protein n=1 Tax=Acrocarpospora phusangensis TaxID=1070424 RepID=A0A919QD67_9ACTN|nr:hypothetical protein [Acrocarpospora phusangensis]GIH25554.1 hypothetical protein Aph01nite_38640 [Acrocarpospora phusangensis]